MARKKRNTCRTTPPCIISFYQVMDRDVDKLIVAGNQKCFFIRTNKYLQKSSVSRVCAVGGFFYFYTSIFNRYHSVYLHPIPFDTRHSHKCLHRTWNNILRVRNGSQRIYMAKKKTNAVKEFALQQHETSQHHNSFHSVIAPTTQMNHSHISNFNHSFGHPITAVHNGPYIVRPSTTTPPTAENLNLTKMSHPREASGSVSPGMPTVTMDLSSVATTNSPHELKRGIIAQMTLKDQKTVTTKWYTEIFLPLWIARLKTLRPNSQLNKWRIHHDNTLAHLTIGAGTVVALGATWCSSTQRNLLWVRSTQSNFVMYMINAETNSKSIMLKPKN
ncbi:hypothetical protein NQ317_006256 [Molorchus minor]|uniref:Uncharacterized protein n=1 Tax=Molorchus minor TaxID=1323400 RepID=A0ABQ9K8M4_9CUCU|nr:hypothetical protein NQ317_006256 [Molorchus minor]